MTKQQRSSLKGPVSNAPRPRQILSIYGLFGESTSALTRERKTSTVLLGSAANPSLSIGSTFWSNSA